MELNPDKTLLTVAISSTLDVQGVEELIRQLAIRREQMSPAVPRTRAIDGDGALFGNDPELTVASTADGAFRLWIRHAGIGWMAFSYSAKRAIGLAQFILDRAKSQEADFIAKQMRDRDGNQH